MRFKSLLRPVSSGLSGCGLTQACPRVDSSPRARGHRDGVGGSAVVWGPPFRPLGNLSARALSLSAPGPPEREADAICIRGHGFHLAVVCPQGTDLVAWPGPTLSCFPLTSAAGPSADVAGTPSRRRLICQPAGKITVSVHRCQGETGNRKSSFNVQAKRGTQLASDSRTVPLLPHLGGAGEDSCWFRERGVVSSWAFPDWRVVRSSGVSIIHLLVPTAPGSPSLRAAHS